MGIFSRLTDIINSNINAILDRAEEPEKIIRLIVQEMEDTLVEVRASAAKTIADKKEIARRLDRFAVTQAEWQGKAELALGKGREDLAKSALLEKTMSSSAIASSRSIHSPRMRPDSVEPGDENFQQRYQGGGDLSRFPILKCAWIIRAQIRGNPHHLHS